MIPNETRCMTLHELHTEQIVKLGEEIIKLKRIVFLLQMTCLITTTTMTVVLMTLP